MDIYSEVVKFAISIIGPALAALLVALVAQLLRKVGISLDAERQAKLEHIVAAMVAQTEEWASARLKSGLTVTARQKAEHYLTLAADKLPGVSREEAHALAQVTLGRLRLGTVAVLQDARQAATTGAR